MKIGCPKGAFGTERIQIPWSISLCSLALNHAFAVFEEHGVKPKYLHCWQTPISKQIYYNWAINQGLKELPVVLIRDPACKPDNNDMDYVGGWLLSDEMPEDAEIVEWNYVFPSRIIIRIDAQGIVERDEFGLKS